METNNENPDKKFLTFDQQVDFVRDKGFIVDETNLNYLRMGLQTYSYYNLINPYLHVIKKDNNGNVIGVDVMTVIIARQIDTKIASLFMPTLLFVEQRLATILSYTIASNPKMGVFHEQISNQKNFYLDSKHYQSEPGLDYNVGGVIQDLKNEIKNKRNNSLAHYFKNRNHIPPWILANSLSFGQLIKWYLILPDELKLEIINSFESLKNIPDEDKLSFFENMLSFIKDLRNHLLHSFPITTFYPKHNLIDEIFNLTIVDHWNKEDYDNNNLVGLVVVGSLLTNPMVDFAYFLQEINRILTQLKTHYPKLRNNLDLIFRTNDIFLAKVDKTLNSWKIFHS